MSNRASPQRTTTYIGRRTDSSRWDSFRPRADDVFICTPPKCGTTWTQAICGLLIFGRVDFEDQIGRISPWLDGKMTPLEACMHMLEEQTHRRFIKTHTHLDGVPYFADCQYLMVYRDPRDAFFSMRNHRKNMRDAPELPPIDADPRSSFHAWLDAPFEPGIGDQHSLETFVQHYQSFTRFSDQSNFHFFHYADFKRDLRASFERIAQALDIELPSTTLNELSDAATFDNMKSRSNAFAPAVGLGIWKSDSAFFSQGRNAQWRDGLGDEELDHYRQRMAQLLPTKDIDWLENGSASLA